MLAVHVGWSVSPDCADLSIESLHDWCGESGGGNVFGEDHAHGVRKLVTEFPLLSRIR